MRQEQRLFKPEVAASQTAAGSIHLQAGSSSAERPFGGDDASQASQPTISGTYAISLAARDENHLLELERKFAQQGIPYRLIREPDMNNAATSIGLLPTNDPEQIKKIRRITSSLPLLGKGMKP